jgi:hypothetical protein
LGLLYHQAPGWPISLGNPSKASRHLNEAVRLHPDYPGNRIALAEFLWDTASTHSLAREWDAIDELIPRARGGIHRPGLGTELDRVEPPAGQIGSQTDSN